MKPSALTELGLDTPPVKTEESAKPVENAPGQGAPEDKTPETPPAKPKDNTRSR